ncbi:MAG TPA: hypothetical protein VNS02_10545 [Rhizobiaceae bacterium]|nr:hypothetical protein [Rhizobiaceae bacterium]
MAKSTELINTIASAVAVVPPATVLLHDRALMDAGERTKTKRGRGAADMTARDAANLLISVLASPIAGPNVKGSVDRWRQYATLASDGGFLKRGKEFDRLDSMWRLPGCEIGHLTALGKGHTASEAIEAIIKSIADRSLHRALGVKDNDSLFTYPHTFRVEFRFPVPIIDITFNNVIEGSGPIQEGHTYYFGGSSAVQGEEAHRRFEAGDMSWSGDLVESRTITLETLRRLGFLIGGRP